MDEIIQWAIGQLGGNTSYEKMVHGDQSTVYRFTTPQGIYFLKIAEELTKEYERLNWLADRPLFPKVNGFMRSEGKDALILTEILGNDLAHLKNEWLPEKVIKKFADALRKFHALGIEDCPFGKPDSGKVLVHGDACLPNFIFLNDELSGYIDLGDLRVDDPAVDLAAAVWSLQYNLGPGYGKQFLEEYGLQNVTDELVEKLRLQYEKMQEEWGLRD